MGIIGWSRRSSYYVVAVREVGFHREAGCSRFGTRRRQCAQVDVGAADRHLDIRRPVTVEASLDTIAG